MLLAPFFWLIPLSDFGPRGLSYRAMNKPEETADQPPLSLARLTAAFAKMLKPGGVSQDDKQQAEDPLADTKGGVTVRGVVEAMLFVGDKENRPLDAQQIADAIRDVSPAEVDTAVNQLNAAYERDEAPYRIEHSPGGYRLNLHKGMQRLSDRVHGRVRAARLSPQALETLSVVAYRQPISSEEIEALRGKGSSAALSQLVRRGLIESAETLPDAEDDAGGPQYQTTDRFLRVFGLSEASQLPRVAELED